MNRLVCVAGSDSTGGAGLAVDARVYKVLGLKATLIRSAATVQGRGGLQSVQATPAAELAARIDAALAGPGRRVVKLGMLPDAKAIEAVAKTLRRHAQKIAWVVADPVMGPSAGGSWADSSWLAAYRRCLPTVVDVLTPNLAEARRLTASARAGAAGCAARLIERGFAGVVLTGGDEGSKAARLEGLCVDHLALAGDGARVLAAKRQRRGCRGSGCTHASALAATLAKGAEPLEAALRANMQVAARLANRGRHIAPTMRQAPLLLPPRARTLAPSPPELARELGVCPLVADAEQLSRLCAARPHSWRSVQLRLKHASTAAVRTQIRRCAKLAAAHGLDLYVNDHWRAACALRPAHSSIVGVHLGQEDLAGANLAAIGRAGLALGVSAHNLTEVCVALAAAPSYVSLGPAFATKSKRVAHAPLHLAGLSRLSCGLQVPCIAIGGITATHASAIAKLGLAGVAAIASTRTPAGLTRMVAAWERGRAGRKGEPAG